MNAVCGQRGEVRRDDGRGQRDDEAVQHAARDVDRSVVPRVFEVHEEIALRQNRKAGGKLRVRTRRVDDHEVEEEQTEERQEHED